MFDPEGRPIGSPDERAAEGAAPDAAKEPQPATPPNDAPAQVASADPAPAWAESGDAPEPSADTQPLVEQGAVAPLGGDPSTTADPLAAGDWPAVGYWAAIRGYPVAPQEQPTATWRPEPPPPTWTRTYEIPSARKVVSAGLQLAVASSATIRRASIYIGLLALGAFGPAGVLLLLGIGRLASIPETTGTLTSDPTLLFYEQPEIIGPLAIVYALAILGAILLVAITIDAEAMAISLLGGTASESPLRLREALARARQTFWRLLGAGLLVGLASTVITLVIAVPFIRPFETNEGLTFVASMLGTLAVVPFAFVSTGIVLGDVGAIEALRRSIALFKARPRIALVVVMFTLVTSAIQSFALGAGLDVASRVAEFLHLGIDQGPIGLILPGLLVLAFIVAFGSLTFTIAAIVAAPQVTGFLGLTFYSGGLDRARDVPGAPPRRAAWVTRPMLASIAGLAVIAGLGLPTIYEFQPRPASPVLELIRTRAEAHQEFVSPYGTPAVLEDPAGDHGIGATGSADILAADVVELYELPAWLLGDVFPCTSADVACGSNRDADAWDLGGFLFIQRMAAVPERVPGRPHAEWGPMLEMESSAGASARSDSRFEGANLRISTEMDGERLRIRELAYESGSWREQPTAARSAWRGHLLVTIAPYSAAYDFPLTWDVYASTSDSAAPGEDNLRGPDGAMRDYGIAPSFEIYGFGIFGSTPAPS